MSLSLSPTSSAHRLWLFSVMAKPLDMLKLTDSNYWTCWKGDAEALLRAQGLLDVVDPAVALPSGVAQMRNWIDMNRKAHGILYSMLSPLVQSKVDSASTMKSGRLLWAQLAEWYPKPTPNSATHPAVQWTDLHPLPTTQWIELSRAIHQHDNPSSPAVITTEHCPTIIPPVPGAHRADLQQGDSGVLFPNHGGEHTEAPATPAAGIVHASSHEVSAEITIDRSVSHITIGFHSTPLSSTRSIFCAIVLCTLVSIVRDQLFFDGLFTLKVAHSPMAWYIVWINVRRIYPWSRSRGKVPINPILCFALVCGWIALNLVVWFKGRK
ncbi:hypothetical protein B0H13DRAFT_2356125 [Mycena leptocephala]|nr:hypothetical protein B0H13DRAFT_2356125 [Mycena leptocephala]